MAFNANDSNDLVVKEGKLFTGLRPMKVVVINPNKAELEAIGYRPQNDPVYITTEEIDEANITKLRLDFLLSSELGEDEGSIRAKIAFFLEDRLRTNKDGDKAEWINDFGRTAWGSLDAAPTEYKWFDHSTARRAYVGEADLHTFLINWLNINPTDEAKLDDFIGLFKGNYGELQSLLSANSNNEVRVLLAVKDGKYQSVYNRYFDRASNKRTNYWESHIKNQTNAGYPPKEDFQSSFIFQSWKEPTTLLDVGEGADAGEGKPEDNPF